jgi:UPF0288 family protein (methanogenesis marker protein 3)
MDVEKQTTTCTKMDEEIRIETAKKEEMMFKVDDRVEIVNPVLEEFKGARGTVVYDNKMHIFEGYQVFEIILDNEVVLKSHNRAVHFYPAKAEEIMKIDVPALTQTKKRKWYQWGRTPNKES